MKSPNVRRKRTAPIRFNQALIMAIAKNHDVTPHFVRIAIREKRRSARAEQIIKDYRRGIREVELAEARAIQSLGLTID